MTRADVVGPAAAQIGFDRIEVTAAVVGVAAGEMPELVRGAHVIVRAIRAARARLVMRAIATIVLVAIILGSLGTRTSCPPASDDAGESADQRADGTTDGPDRRASKAAGNSSS